MQIPREQLLTQLAKLEQRYIEVEHQVAASAVDLSGDPLPAPRARQAGQTYQSLSKELSDLREIVMAYRTYLRIERDALEAEALFRAQGDLEVRQFAKEEAVALR